MRRKRNYMFSRPLSYILVPYFYERRYTIPTKELPPYELSIYATIQKDPTIDEVTTERIYYNWYDTFEEAIDKFNQKKEWDVNEIINTKHFDWYPASKVSIQLICGNSIIKEEVYNI